LRQRRLRLTKDAAASLLAYGGKWRQLGKLRDGARFFGREHLS